MNVASIKFNIQKRGIAGCVFFYAGQLHKRCGIMLMKLVVALRKSARDVIVLKNNKNTDFSDNTKALYEYMLANRMNERYTIVWCVSDPGRYKSEKKPNVKFVMTEGKNDWTSLRAIYYGATAKYFFFTHDTSMINKVRCPDQISVNVGHGNGYKAPKKDLATRLDDNYQFDYLLVSGPVFVEPISRYWNCPEDKILALGFPRYDYLLKSSDRGDILYRLLGRRQLYDKIILWLPTFFNNDENSFPENSIDVALGFSGVNSEQELALVDKCCADNNICLFIKRHPAQVKWIRSDTEYTNVFFLDDAQLTAAGISVFTVMNIADALLTDFSSSAVDYLLLDRPIGFIMTEYERFSLTRGFIFDDPLKYMPGEKLYTVSDITRFILNLVQGRDPYKAERASMKKLMHNAVPCYSECFADHFKL